MVIIDITFELHSDKSWCPLLLVIQKGKKNSVRGGMAPPAGGKTTLAKNAKQGV